MRLEQSTQAVSHFSFSSRTADLMSYMFLVLAHKSLDRALSLPTSLLLSIYFILLVKTMSEFSDLCIVYLNAAQQMNE